MQENKPLNPKPKTTKKSEFLYRMIDSIKPLMKMNSLAAFTFCHLLSLYSQIL